MLSAWSPCRSRCRARSSQKEGKKHAHAYVIYEPIECALTPGYIGRMIRRILLAMFVAWFAITPAIAGSCAAECAKASRDAAERHSQTEQQSAVPDCHQASKHDGPSHDTDSPSKGAMAVACLAAATVGVPTSMLLPATIDLSIKHDIPVLLPFVSFQSSPPYKPPRA